MIDTISLLTSNLTEAFKQLNQYLALGLITSMSAFIVDRSRDTKQISIQGLPPLSRDAATLVLMGISFVAGLMGLNAADNATGIVNRLRGSQEVLAAVCTFPSIATAPVGIPIIAAALPVIFVAPVFYRQWKALAGPGEDARGGVVGMFSGFAFVYGILGWRLALSPCHAS